MTERSPELERLFEQARQSGLDEPSDDDQARVGRSLALALGLPVTGWEAADAGASSSASASSAGSAASTSIAPAAAASAVGLKLGIAIGVVGIAAAALVLTQRSGSHTTVPAPSMIAPNASAPAPSVPLPNPSPAPSDTPSSTTVVDNDAPERTAPAGPQLKAELGLLDAASRALDRGDAQSALRALHAHEQRFGAGILRQEREGLRVMALCRSGALEQAAMARAAFEREAPHSPLRARVAAFCDSNPAGKKP